MLVRSIRSALHAHRASCAAIDPRRKALGSLAAFTGVVALALPAAAGPVSTWLDASDGVWADPARWSLGFVPGQGENVGADASIDATGTPYIVTLRTATSLHDLTVASDDATLSITEGGTLSLSGAGSISAGTVLLNNGAIDGGAWTAAGQGLIRVQGLVGNRLANATVAGDVLLDAASILSVGNSVVERWRLAGNASILHFTGDVALDTTLSFEGPGGSARLVRSGAADAEFSIGSAGVVETADGFEGRGFIGALQYTNETATNEGRVTASSGIIAFGAASITNNGRMQALGGDIVAHGDEFTNAGSIEVMDAQLRMTTQNPASAAGMTNTGTIVAADATLDFAVGLHNSGSIDAARSTVSIDAARFTSTGQFDLRDSTLRVTGDFGVADLTPITRTNSTITIAGTLFNAGETLDLDALPDRLALDGGAIVGGSVIGGDASPLRVSDSVHNALDGVAVNGRVSLDVENAFLRLRNGASIAGEIDMASTRSELRFDGDATLDDVILHAGVSYLSSDLIGRTLTIGGSTLIDGAALYNEPESTPGYAFETIINRGSMIVGPNWQLQGAQAVINEGMIEIGSGADLVVGAGFDPSTGLVAIGTGGEFQLIERPGSGLVMPDFFAGGIENHGVLRIAATVDLGGQTVALGGAYGDVRLGAEFSGSFGGTIRNGVLNIEDGASLTLGSGPTSLQNLTVNGTVGTTTEGTTTLLNLTATRLEMRSESLNILDSAISETRFERGVLVAADPSDLGNIHIVGEYPATLRLATTSGGVLDNTSLFFEPGSRLTIDTIPALGTLTNRLDFASVENARVTLKADRVVNEGDIALGNLGVLTIEGDSPFLNPGSITLDDGFLALDTPFDFDQILNDRNDLANGVVTAVRTLDLDGAAVTLGADAGEWRLGSNASLSNGVIDNAAGQTFTVLGGQSGSRPDTRLENIEFTGDLRMRSAVEIGESVRFRSLTFESDLYYDPDIAVEGLIVQAQNENVRLFLGSSPTGTAHIAQGATIVASGAEQGNFADLFQIVAASATPFLENDGAIVLKRAGRMRGVEIGKLINHGSISLDSFSDFNLADASVINNGSIQLTNDALLQMNGDFMLGDEGSLRFDIAASPTSFDGIAVGDTARLGGGLDITITDDTALTLGDEYDILRSGLITGEFAAITIEQGDDPELRLLLRRAQTELDLLVRHVADVDGDMAVDQRDLGIVFADYGMVGALLAGDANTDGVVDFVDVNTVLSNFGRTFRAVPAPATAHLLALTALLMGGRRRSGRTL